MDPKGKIVQIKTNRKSAKKLLIIASLQYSHFLRKFAQAPLFLTFLFFPLKKTLHMVIFTNLF